MKNENKSINYVQITYVEITKKKKKILQNKCYTVNILSTRKHWF